MAKRTKTTVAINADGSQRAKVMERLGKRKSTFLPLFVASRNQKLPQCRPCLNFSNIKGLRVILGDENADLCPSFSSGSCVSNLSYTRKFKVKFHYQNLYFPFKRKLLCQYFSTIRTTESNFPSSLGNINQPTHAHFSNHPPLLSSIFTTFKQKSNRNSPSEKMVHRSNNLVDLDFELDDPGYLLSPDFEIFLEEGDRLVFPSNLFSDPFLPHLDPNSHLAIQFELFPPCIIDQWNFTSGPVLPTSGETLCASNDDGAQGEGEKSPPIPIETHVSNSSISDMVSYNQNQSQNTHSYESLLDLISLMKL